MTDVVRIESPADAGPAIAIAGAAPLAPEDLAFDNPQETWVLRAAGGRIAARGSIWWRDAPALAGQRTGLVGHYGALDAASGSRLLAHLCTRLAAERCAVAVGPMDGSTWRKYRLVVEPGVGPFFLDVDNPADWPDHFRAADFTTLAEYASTVVEDLSLGEDRRTERVAQRLDGIGLRIRALEPARAENELAALHRLSLVAFRHAFLFSPIDASRFLSLYRPLLAYVDPRLVLLAEHDDRLVGYIFAIPDRNEIARGTRLRTLVVKTVAVLPDRAYAGLGALLLSQLHQRGREIGLDRAIHALMHVSNASRALSGHWQGRPIRRYELFTRHLSP
jgi:GNAT superfamily N-acetyltransferase